MGPPHGVGQLTRHPTGFTTIKIYVFQLPCLSHTKYPIPVMCVCVFMCVRHLMYHIFKGHVVCGDSLNAGASRKARCGDVSFEGEAP